MLKHGQSGPRTTGIGTEIRNEGYTDRRDSEETMIKVLMCGNHPSNRGGMTSVISQIREYNWEKEGVNLRFIPTYLPGNPLKKTAFFIKSYYRIRQVMKKDKPEILHVHMSYKGSFTRTNYLHRLCLKYGVKDIIHLHGSEFEKWYNASPESKKRKIRALLRECSAIIVLGESWKHVVGSIEPSANVVVISNGVKIPDACVRWDPDRCQLLYLGVLIPRKGLRDLLDAVKILKEKGKLQGRRFVIAGSGEEEEQLKARTKELGLTEEVFFAGWVDGEKKEKLITDSQVLLSPSYNEGLPVSILEAAAHGMPIVSTDVGDISSVVRDGENGILIQPGQIGELADGILTVSEEETFGKMSRRSREIAEESFSIDLFYEKLNRLYHRIAAGQRTDL